MFGNRPIATFLAIVLFAAPMWAQGQIPKQAPSVPSQTRGTRPAEASPSSPPSSSASVAARFWEIGYEIAHSANITGPQADQAIILLTAAKSLDSRIAGVEPLLLKLATRCSEKDYTLPVIFWLEKYVSASADRAVVMDAVGGMLNRLNSLEERKAMLEKLIVKLRNKNPAIDSELATSLGLLMLERKELEPAKYYLVQACKNNRFNRVAFDKLAELAPSEIGPATNLEHLRLLVRENPLDLKAALDFAGYAERLQLYDVAAQSYEYCAALFRYLYPSDPLPPHVYLPWAISCYNTRQGLQMCVQIAEIVRDLKRFDILLEAVAGKAAVKMGKPQEAQAIFQQAEQRAQELLALGPGQSLAGPNDVTPVRPVNAKQLAWFYCFADADPEKAVDWANRAYAAEPNSPSAGALLAYALSITNKLDLARSLLAPAEQSQIADLVHARMQLAAGNKAGALQTIQNTVAKDAGSLAAEKAKELLRELGSEYLPPNDRKTLTDFLTERLGSAHIPQFTPPDQMVSAQFTIRGTDLSYGNGLEGAVSIINKGREPLVISDNSLFQGNIRVSARVAGDVKREIPNLVSETVRTDLIVPPGRSVVHPVRLSTGELHDLLTTYPQASLEIQFTLYLDPVITSTGEITNRLVDVMPATASVRRPRVLVTRDLVLSRSNGIASGPEAQNTQTARLFTGLLKEQQAMTEKVLYSFKYEDWLPGQLRSSLMGPTGLLLGGARGEWVVKVNTMADMLDMPVDQEMAAVVLKNVNHPQWPVRLMAVYLLGQSVPNSIGNVLDWVVKNDKDELVRSLALSLQSASSNTMTLRSVTPQPTPAARP